MVLLNSGCNSVGTLAFRRGTSLSLTEDLVTAKLPDLAKSLNTIESAVEDWWGSAHLWWYTDHGPSHSRRVAEYCEKLRAVRVFPAGLELNVMERYLLTAAAWMHDVGMQAKTPPTTDDAINDVRRLHPERSHQLLAESTIEFGVSNPVVIDAIAVLAKSHGTEFYRKVVDGIEENRSISGYPVRLRLLAALLLMADELDLRVERAVTKNKGTEFLPVTAAHWLKHQTVSAAEVGMNGGDVEIQITLAQPPNMTDELLGMIQEWIVTKLQTQIGLIEPEIRSGFDAHFTFARAIRVDRIKVSIPNGLITSDVIAVIDSENARAALINHVDSFNLLAKALKDGKSGQIIGPLSDGAEDTNGREDFLDAIAKQMRSKGVWIMRHWRSDASLSATPADVLTSWACDLDIEIRENMAFENESTQRGELLGLIITRISGINARHLLIASDVDKMSKKDRKWLRDVCFHQLSKIEGVSVLVSTSDHARVDLGSDQWHSEVLQDLPKSAMTAYLARYIDYRSAQNHTTPSSTYHSTKTKALDEKIQMTAI
jgi:hypothetical protein